MVMSEVWQSEPRVLAFSLLLVSFGRSRNLGLFALFLFDYQCHLSVKSVPLCSLISLYPIHHQKFLSLS